METAPGGAAETRTERIPVCAGLKGTRAGDRGQVSRTLPVPGSGACPCSLDLEQLQGKAEQASAAAPGRGLGGQGGPLRTAPLAPYISSPRAA